MLTSDTHTILTTDLQWNTFWCVDFSCLSRFKCFFTDASCVFGFFYINLTTVTGFGANAHYLPLQKTLGSQSWHPSATITDEFCFGLPGLYFRLSQQTRLTATDFALFWRWAQIVWWKQYGFLITFPGSGAILFNNFPSRHYFCHHPFFLSTIPSTVLI